MTINKNTAIIGMFFAFNVKMVCASKHGMIGRLSRGMNGYRDESFEQTVSS